MVVLGAFIGYTTDLHKALKLFIRGVLFQNLVEVLFVMIVCFLMEGIPHDRMLEKVLARE